MIHLAEAVISTRKSCGSSLSNIDLKKCINHRKSRQSSRIWNEIMITYRNGKNEKKLRFHAVIVDRSQNFLHQRWNLKKRRGSFRIQNYLVNQKIILILVSRGLSFRIHNNQRNLQNFNKDNAKFGVKLSLFFIYNIIVKKARTSFNINPFSAFSNISRVIYLKTDGAYLGNWINSIDMKTSRVYKYSFWWIPWSNSRLHKYFLNVQCWLNKR